MEDMPLSTLFHVIEAKTSYNILLGQPQLYDYGIIHYTLLKLKYYEDRVQKKIVLDCRSFLEAKSHFNDPKFYSRV